MAALVRPWPERVAGAPESYTFDATTSTFTLTYHPDAATTAPTVIMVPDRAYPDGYTVVEACGGCATERAAGEPSTSRPRRRAGPWWSPCTRSDRGWPMLRACPQRCSSTSRRTAFASPTSRRAAAPSPSSSTASPTPPTPGTACARPSPPRASALSNSVHPRLRAHRDPRPSEAYDADTLGRDALALISAPGEEKAFLVGHDFQGRGWPIRPPASRRSGSGCSSPSPSPTPPPSSPTPSLAVERAALFHASRGSGAAARIRAGNYEHIDALVHRWSPAWKVPPGETDPVKGRVPRARVPGRGARVLPRAAPLAPRGSTHQACAVPAAAFAGTTDVVPPSAHERARLALRRPLPGGDDARRALHAPASTRSVFVRRSCYAPVLGNDQAIPLVDRSEGSGGGLRQEGATPVAARRSTKPRRRDEIEDRLGGGGLEGIATDPVDPLDASDMPRSRALGEKPLARVVQKHHVLQRALGRLDTR